MNAQFLFFYFLLCTSVFCCDAFTLEFTKTKANCWRLLILPFFFLSHRSFSFFFLSTFFSLMFGKNQLYTIVNQQKLCFFHLILILRSFSSPSPSPLSYHTHILSCLLDGRHCTRSAIANQEKQKQKTAPPLSKKERL